MKNILPAIVASAAVLLSGCGTIVNLCSGDPEIPLGGVQKDLQVVDSPRASGFGTGKSAALVVLLIPVELCLSVVGDTLTLPLAIFIKRAGYPPRDNEPVAASAPRDGAAAPPPSAAATDAPKTETDDEPGPALSDSAVREILKRLKDTSATGRAALGSACTNPGEAVAAGCVVASIMSSSDQSSPAVPASPSLPAMSSMAPPRLSAGK
jgi:uncharacterized protein YceK